MLVGANGVAANTTQDGAAAVAATTRVMSDGLGSISKFGLAASDCTSIMIGGCRDSFLIKLCVRNESYHHDCCRILTL